MQNHERQNQAAGLNLADIYYTLFRHKWKIIGLSAAGLLAAALVYYLQPSVYSSEAKLFIRYVAETRLPTSGTGGDPQIKMPDPGGANIIASEIQIISSLDVAGQVADAIGVEKILGNGGGETNRTTAAALIRKSLTLDSPPHSDILRIVFRHPNRQIVQPVLTQLIDAYLRKHVEIHRNAGAFDDILTQQTDALRSQLAQTEVELRRAKTNAGLISLEDAQKRYNEEISRTREVLFNTQVELAEREAEFQERQKLMPAPFQVSTNRPDGAVPAAKVDAYRSLCVRLEFFRRREQELLTQFTDESSTVRSIREQIASAEKLRKNLEAEYPILSQIQRPSSQPGTPPRDWSGELVQIYALQVKTNVLKTHLEQLTAGAQAVNEVEPAIMGLQRQKDLEEIKFRHFSTSLEQARFDEALNAGKMLNISVAQTPSPPYVEAPRLVKTLGMIVGGGVFGSIALAFLIELFLDPTIRRPTEVETRLHLPLFLTIPRMRWNSRPALPAPAVPGAGQPAPGEAGAEPGTNKKSEVAPWHANGLATYYEALRDRLVTYFEVHNLLHKPKLIAVTGCGKGVGVTTIAAGLAASLSETGDGNVLLVDMTTGQGAAHPFFKGKLGVGLADALGSGTRENALVQENLYAVAERGNGGLLPRVLPRRFGNLVPKLKASDYDYIIFDMPPVSQISVTARLAGFMDTVLLVIESEKTDRDVAKRAGAMLAEPKANVCAVLNKTRRYVPERLEQEI